MVKKSNTAINFLIFDSCSKIPLEHFSPRYMKIHYTIILIQSILRHIYPPSNTFLKYF